MRRLLALGLLGLILGIGVAATLHASDGREETTEQEQPCVVRADCAGASILISVGLAVILPSAASAITGRVPVAKVISLPGALRTALLTSRLYRPPRPLLTAS